MLSCIVFVCVMLFVDRSKWDVGWRACRPGSKTQSGEALVGSRCPSVRPQVTLLPIHCMHAIQLSICTDIMSTSFIQCPPFLCCPLFSLSVSHLVHWRRLVKYTGGGQPKYLEGTRGGNNCDLKDFQLLEITCPICLHPPQVYTYALGCHLSVWLPICFCPSVIL